jgi:hypothetical protein
VSGGPDPREVLTTFGPITVTRRHFRCPSCKEAGYAADPLIGIDGYLSPGTLRLACRFSADRSFALAAQRFFECFEVGVSAETLRRHCTVPGGAIADWVRTDPGATDSFRRVAGESEIQVDAGKVNTTDGWRDLKVVVLAKRTRGPAATPAQWDTRELPHPTARVVLADIEGIDTFRREWSRWAQRWGLGTGQQLTVLGDGAEWIWNAAERQFPGCRQVLDVYHALEYVAEAAKGLYGEGTEATQSSYTRGRSRLLEEGWAGVCRWVGEELAQADNEARREAVETLTTYLSKHTSRLEYRSRLAEGRSIGSGLVEGTIKTLGLRMKARGARWVERNAEHMVALVGLSNSTLWDDYWALAA